LRHECWKQEMPEISHTEVFEKMKCPICGSIDIEYVPTTGSDVCACRDCGHRFSVVWIWVSL